MKNAREIYDSYLGKLREQHPQDESLMRAAIDAFDSIQAGEQITPRLLQPIVDAASDSRRLIYDIPVGFLQELTGKHEEARMAVSKLAVDKRSHTRFNSIMCIGRTAPKSFKLQLLRQGLRDKSSKVRWKSADWAGRQRLRELVPELEEAFASEKHEKARSTIVFDLKLLRDGYILEQETDGRFRVTAFTPNGVGSRWFEQMELERRGIEAIVAEFASYPLG